MIAKHLVCVTCKNRFDLGPMFEGCPACRERGTVSAVEVDYDYEAVRSGLDISRWLAGPRGVWKYADLMPVSDPGGAVTLGEGDTPLTRVHTLTRETGLENLYIKNETCNPTWSFKDRQSVVSIAAARELGYKRVTTSSTGNHGASTAAYAAATGMSCAVFCHPETPKVQHDLIRFYGARSFSLKDRRQFLTALVREFGYYPCTGLTPMPVASPFGVEGYKAIAYETVMQLDGRVPDRVYMPVAGGHGIYGIFKGYRELQSLAVADRIPRMFGCQARGCNPFVRSFQAGHQEVTTVRNPASIALSIRDETGGDCGLRAIYGSGGAAVDASDPEIVRAARLLARGGIAVEPSSAASVACLLNAAKAGEIPPRELVVCVVTGAAPKWPDDLDRMVEEPIIQNPNFEALKLALWL